MGLEIIENERVDVSKFHPSVQALYGDGMPIRTYRTERGTIVRFFGTALPKTEEENQRRLREAWRVQDIIWENIARREAQKNKERSEENDTGIESCRYGTDRAG